MVFIEPLLFRLLFDLSGDGFVGLSARVFSRVRDNTGIAGNPSTSRTFRGVEWGRVVRYGHILNLGWLSALLLVVFLFCSVAFFLYWFHKPEKERGLVRNGCRVFLGTFFRCPPLL